MTQPRSVREVKARLLRNNGPGGSLVPITEGDPIVVRTSTICSFAPAAVANVVARPAT
jgi:hypothetical protein